MTAYRREPAELKFVEVFKAEVQAEIEKGGSAVTSRQVDEALATVAARHLFELERMLEDHVDRIEILEYQ